MAKYKITVIMQVAADDATGEIGNFDSPEAIGKIIADAFYAKGGVWKFESIPDAPYGPPVIITPVPVSPLTAKKWKVAFGPSNVHSGHSAGDSVVKTIQTGTVITEIEEWFNGAIGWVQFSGGWVLLKQLVEV